ncbi:hypothetical protein SISNIDRAFT_483787 [Sistotremastrum niveocremeum HHB9708]|uniref:Uncharacterized protein n=1 Tax=Sistotremastrum niveocremeum HHB9708 TaxID=1314777 RepID=A0A164X1L9_9AGAM|nr:hypothetical protein SISNIDRAFT_483787 [Sistotremastrum niveocremeum HHB9708]
MSSINCEDIGHFPAPTATYARELIVVTTIEAARPHIAAFLQQKIHILKLHLNLPAPQSDELLEQIFAENPSLDPENDSGDFKLDVLPNGLLVMEYTDVVHDYTASAFGRLLNAKKENGRLDVELSGKLGRINVVSIGGRHLDSTGKPFICDLIVTVEQTQKFDPYNPRREDLDSRTTILCEVSNSQTVKDMRKKLAVCCVAALAPTAILINLEQNPDFNVKSASFEHWQLFDFSKNVDLKDNTWNPNVPSGDYRHNAATAKRPASFEVVWTDSDVALGVCHSVWWAKREIPEFYQQHLSNNEPDIEFSYFDAYGLSSFSNAELVEMGTSPKEMKQVWRRVNVGSLAYEILIGSVTDEEHKHTPSAEEAEERDLPLRGLKRRWDEEARSAEKRTKSE